jgi:putative inorganic carbon (hco3(-)) transporter
MSSILFFAMMVAFCGTAIVFPFGGLLFYIWLELLSPQLIMFGPFQNLNYSLVLGLCVFIGWLFKEKGKLKQLDFLVVCLCLFALWISVATIQAVFPEPAFVKWDRTIKILAAAVLLALMLNSRDRVEAFLWALTIIFGLLAFRGALRTIETGGGGGLIVVGMGGFLTDRNVLALALAMAIPLMLCLGRYSKVFPRNRTFSLVVFFGCAASLIGLLGTQSRGGILALAVVGIVMTLFTDKKIVAACTTTFIAALVLAFAPQELWDRMSSIKDYEQESSAAGRVNAWNWAWNYFLEHPMGGGFGIFRLNVAGVTNDSYGGYLEAHSTFFESIAESGFIGTGLFVTLMIYSVIATLICLRKAKSANDVYVQRICQAVLAMLAGLYVGSMFLSLSTSPLFFYMFALSGRLRVMLQSKQSLPTPRSAKAFVKSNERKHA